MGLEDHLHPLQSRYIAGPQWLRSFVGQGYALLPRQFRHGPAYARFQAEAACTDAATVAQLARQKLAATLEHAIRSVPAYAPYRDLLAKLDDPLHCLAQLPVVAKGDIKRDPAAYQVADAAVRGLRTFTGGSTAQPMEFYLERHVTRARETAYIDHINTQLLKRGRRDLVLSLHGRTVRGADKPGGQLWMHEPIKRECIFSTDHLERRYMPQYVAVLREQRPVQIHAYPSALLPLAQWLAEFPCGEFSGGVQGILLTSENIQQVQLQVFRRAFPNARIVSHYGHSERVLMGVADGESAQYVFFPLYGHLELVDAAGHRIDAPGVAGEIVGTSFDNRVMPFVRYRSGDLGTWSEQPNGLPAVLQSIDGRTQDFVVCRDRRLVSVTTLGAAHFAELAAAEMIQYEQREPGCVELKVVAPRALRTEEIAHIRQAVLAKTQGGCDARVVQVAQLARTARGKHRMLVQHLDLALYFGAGAQRVEDATPGA
ncbi:MAG TPA: hypothetical protein VGN52_14050 [Burkholderiales bacterium]